MYLRFCHGAKLKCMHPNAPIWLLAESQIHYQAKFFTDSATDILLSSHSLYLQYCSSLYLINTT